MMRSRFLIRFCFRIAIRTVRLLLIMATCGVKVADAQWVQTNIPNSPYGVIGGCLAAKGSQLFAGTAVGLYTTTDFGDNWTSLRGLPDSCIQTIAIVPSADSAGFEIFVATCGFPMRKCGIFCSSDSGKSWTRRSTGLNDTWFFSLAWDGSTIYAGSNKGTIYSSTNHEEDWIPLTEGPHGHPVYSMEIWKSNVYVATSGADAGGGIFLSTNGGRLWQNLNNGANFLDLTTIETWSPDPLSNTPVLFVGTFFQGVYLSTDNGAVWKTVNSGLTELKVNALYKPENLDNTLFLASRGGGVFLSGLNEVRWQPINSGLGNLFAMCFAISGPYLFVGTDPAGVWRRPLSELVSVLPEAAGPERISLDPPHPNPVQGRTAVAFRLSITGHVRLRLFDLLGRQIALLLDEIREAGGHEVPFDASRLPGGTYFLRLEVGGRVLFEKMSVLR